MNFALFRDAQGGRTFCTHTQAAPTLVKFGQREQLSGQSPKGKPLAVSPVLEVSTLPWLGLVSESEAATKCHVRATISLGKHLTTGI